MAKLLECVPNYSEGRDLDKVEQIVGCFRGRQGVKLLDYSSDADHNRTVVTVIGEPEALVAAVVDSVGKALELIDMTKHKGQHPRMGAVDVIPFIPVRETTVEDADAAAKAAAAAASEKFGQPFFLYESSATAPNRVNLAEIRRGQFEGMAEKMKDQAHWKPDYGPATIHPTGGVTAIGARPPLVAYNVDLDTSDLAVADKIVHMVRHINGGFRYCKAMAVELKERGIVQVSMNLTDYSKTAIYRVLENLLSNAQKYSAPGSRVYIRLYSSDGCGCFEIKNISKDALNISAEELMERFVRGDRSRSEEGNGLGLSIAKEENICSRSRAVRGRALCVERGGRRALKRRRKHGCSAACACKFGKRRAGWVEPGAYNAFKRRAGGNAHLPRPAGDV